MIICLFVLFIRDLSNQTLSERGKRETNFVFRRMIFFGRKTETAEGDGKIFNTKSRQKKTEEKNYNTQQQAVDFPPL